METQFKPNWTLLESLRNRFLSEEFSPTTSYWSTEEVLEQYHSTFAERIGWKWDAVLRDFETKLSQSSIVPKALLDWGCGTGIAALKLAEKFYRRGLEEIVLWDRSPASIRFSMKMIQNQFPLLKVRAWDCQEVPKDFVLVCSHILNELSSEAEKELKRIIDLSQWVFWVEPGTPEHSRKLIELRESLRSHFTVVAPCPHQLSCGLLDHSQKNNWCHFFASPPNQVFRDGFWKQFSQKLGIDLRSLPTSFLVLSKTALLDTKLSHPQKRVLGRMRNYKGYSLALTCSENGISQQKLLQRNSSQVIDLLRENEFSAWLH